MYSMFDFDQRRLTELARRAKKLGCELFVLDDGWFGERNDDRAGLGDYEVNRKKLPDGLDGLAAKIGRMGMKFGLWFEPEAVNPDSGLFRAHPDWALTEPGRDGLLSRHELLLDLTKSEVRDYIVSSVSGVLDGADISYVKWDMFVLPLIFIAAGYFIYLKKYKIDSGFYKQILSDLEERGELRTDSEDK